MFQINLQLFVLQVIDFPVIVELLHQLASIVQNGHSSLFGLDRRDDIPISLEQHSPRLLETVQLHGQLLSNILPICKLVLQKLVRVQNLSNGFAHRQKQVVPFINVHDQAIEEHSPDSGDSRKFQQKLFGQGRREMLRVHFEAVQFLLDVVFAHVQDVLDFDLGLVVAFSLFELFPDQVTDNFVGSQSHFADHLRLFVLLLCFLLLFDVVVEIQHHVLEHSSSIFQNHVIRFLDLHVFGRLQFLKFHLFQVIFII